MKKIILLSLLFFATASFAAFTVSLLNITTDFGHGCQYYMLNMSVGATAIGTPSQSYHAVIGSIKDGGWSYLANLNGTRQVWQPNGTCSNYTGINGSTGQTCTDNGYYVQQNYTYQQWMPYTTTKYFPQPTELEYCANYTMVNNAVSIDIIPTIGGKSFPQYAWFNASWASCENIIISGAYPAKYPYLIQLNSSNLNYAHTASGGADLRFLNGTCLNATGNPLGEFIEQWNTAGNSLVFVNLSTANATHIAMYYNNPSAMPVSDITDVFGAGIIRAFPLQGNLTDFASGYNLTNYGASITRGRRGWDTAYNTSASSGTSLTGADTGLPTGTANSTMCAWVNNINYTYPNANAQIIVGYGTNVNHQERALYSGMSGSTTVYQTGDKSIAFNAGKVITKNWTLVCSVTSGRNWNITSIYSNSTITTGSGSVSENTVLHNLSVGNGNGGTYSWNGSIQDAYVWNVALTQAQIASLFAYPEPTITFSSEQTSAILINISSPTNTTYPINNPGINVTCNSSGTHASELLSITSDGSYILANQTVSDGVLFSFTNTSFTPGAHTLNATCWNGSNQNSSVVTFTFAPPVLHFVSPTPANNTNDFTFPMALNMSANFPLSPGSYMEIDGANYSCSNAADNLSCSYTIPYSGTVFNHTYSAKGYANISGTYYAANETRIVPYYGCGQVTASGTLIGNVSINGSTCFTLAASGIVFDGQGYTITGNSTVGLSSPPVHSEFRTPPQIGISASVVCPDCGASSVNVNISNFRITGFDTGVWIFSWNFGYPTSDNLNNIAVYNNSYGIDLEAELSFNNLTNINAYNNSVGINFNIYAPSYNNIFNSTIYNNTYYGIFLTDDHDIISGNNVYDNGVQMFSDSGNGMGPNLIYNNIFNATGTEGVVWDNWGDAWNTTEDCSTKNIIGGNCTGGNWYSDYNGTDADGDGIGETLYPIYGGFATDYLPLTNVDPMMAAASGSSAATVTSSGSSVGTARKMPAAHRRRGHIQDPSSVDLPDSGKTG